MVDRKVSARLMPLLKSGEVLDMLSKEVANGSFSFAYPDGGEPKASILIEVLKKTDVHTAKDIARKATDPQVLAYAAAKDRRKGVVAELIKNQNLPFDSALELARGFIKAGDTPSIGDLLSKGNKSNAFKIAKILVAEEATSVVDRRALIKAAANAATNESFDFALKLLDDRRALQSLLFKFSCFRGSRVSTQRLLDLYQAQIHHQSSYRNLRHVAPGSAPAELVRRALKGSSSFRDQLLKLDSEEIVWELLQESLKPEPLVSTLEVIQNMRGDWIASLQAFLRDQEIEITVEVLKEMLRLYSRNDFLRSDRLNWTKEAIEFLVDQDVKLENSFYAKLTDPAKLFKVLDEDAERAGDIVYWLSFAQLDAFLDIGVPVEKVVALMALKFERAVPKAFEVPARVLKLYLEGAPRYPRNLAGAKLTDAELEILLTRASENPKLVRGSEIFKEMITQVKPKKTRIKRAQLIKMISIQPELFTVWVNGHDSVKPRAGDFKTLDSILDQEGRELIYQDVLRLGDFAPARVWLDEALDLIPELVSKTGPGVSYFIVQRLEAEFGQNALLWQTGLTLLPTWTGTLKELTQTAKAL